MLRPNQPSHRWNTGWRQTQTRVREVAFGAAPAKRALQRVFANGTGRGAAANADGAGRNRLIPKAGLASLAAVAAVALAACGSASNTDAGAANGSGGPSQEPTAQATIEIEDNHGLVTVPVRPSRVVALDNRAFEALAQWDVELVAAPKSLMGDGVFPKYSEDQDLPDVGTHREPNLEVIVAAEPDLIIGGMRFASHYDAITQQNPGVPVIELSPRDGEDLNQEIKREMAALGQIFDREAEAQQAIDALDRSVGTAKDAYNGSDTVVGLLTSGGKISYAAPTTGRSVGVVFPALGLKPGIDKEASDQSHGDDISVEAIAAAAPDWLIVLDRDGAVGESGAIAAKELIGQSEALAGVPAVAQDQVIYLDPSFYLTEDIFAYTALYDQIAKAFKAADAV
ncbi:MAG: ABC transporter substrate-binding protein [Bifidobacteriaceae bacterium]|jgi:iron complex transport system substrate-binding protein|nr:ABC transporter substrate-binding protein [Bifidobacteriaceae bacterium]